MQTARSLETFGPQSVSVVIPAFNRLRKLQEAIASVQAQSWPPLEIVVVDDASTPPIRPADLPSGPVPVRLHRQPTNRGGGAARNAGIDLARGQRIALLDSDDTWMPSKLQRQLQRLEFLGASGDYDVAACNVLLRNADGTEHPYNTLPMPPGPPAEWFLLDHQTLQTSGLLLTRALAAHVRFREDLRLHQDWDFVLRLCAAGARVHYEEQCRLIYDNTTTAQRVSQTDDVERTLYWIDTSPVELIPRSVRHRLYLYLIHERYRRRAPIRAWSRLLRESFAYPTAPLITARHGMHRVKQARHRPRGRSGDPDRSLGRSAE